MLMGLYGICNKKIVALMVIVAYDVVFDVYVANQGNIYTIQKSK